MSKLLTRGKQTMLRDVLEAEAQIAYHAEGERLAGVPFPSLQNKPSRWRWCAFKQGGLWFLCLGYYRFSFCKVKG